MKILMVGDIVGSPGRQVFGRVVTRMKKEKLTDFVVANAENAAGGKGVTGPIAEELLSVGADILTLGDHTWDQKELTPYIEKAERLIRPANFPPGCPGSGLKILDVGLGSVAVINLVGRTFMQANDCPFRTVDAVLKKCAGVKTILVDFHAEATSEKIAMGRYLDGRVTCMVGTHTHVQTSDETLLPGGTAYITDLGMTGPKESVIGRDAKTILARFITGMPAKFIVASGNPVLEGIVIDVDNGTGKAFGIERIRCSE
ncbi:MAG: TIGR00282 family metallophosphoesterase [Lentisphaerae bacterium]|nr:TIGR00282 family metallophosphoesterase [Lentisphaerota bacterium]